MASSQEYNNVYFTGDQHYGVCKNLGSDEVQQIRGDELWEDVKGHEVSLWLWETGKEGSLGNGEREASLLQVCGYDNGFSGNHSLVLCMWLSAIVSLVQK